MERILLHVCCAPCATVPLERLAGDFEIVGYFFNPNIQPFEEYGKRLEEARRFFDREGIELIEGPYSADEWNTAVRGHEKDPEGGARCDLCFIIRMIEAAKVSLKNGCNRFTTTLTVSRHKRSKAVHRAGEIAAERTGAVFQPDDFKKKGGSDRVVELSRKNGLYMQSYCGCVYSRGEKK